MTFDPLSGLPPAREMSTGTQRLLRTSQRLTMLFLWAALGLFALVMLLVAIAVVS